MRVILQGAWWNFLRAFNERFLREDMSENMRNHEAEKTTGMIPAIVFGRGQRQSFALQNGYLAWAGVISGTLEMTSHAKLSSAMSEDRRE